jgi:hypothetical protein
MEGLKLHKLGLLSRAIFIITARPEKKKIRLFSIINCLAVTAHVVTI